MTVSTFAQPSFTSQDAATYKANIDSAIAVLAEIGKPFAPREMGVLGMGITIEASSLSDGTVIAAANVTAIGAPVANPRIDRVYFDPYTATFTRIVGAEAVSPVPPTLPAGAYPIAQIYLIVGMTVIANTDIIDERSPISAGESSVSASAGYTNILDQLGASRIIIGKLGTDNRIIVRIHTATNLSSFVVQNSALADLFVVNGAGRVLVNGAIDDGVSGLQVLNSIKFTGKLFSASNVAFVTLTTTALQLYASTLFGALISGYGTSSDVTMVDRAGTLRLQINASGIIMRDVNNALRALFDVSGLAVTGLLSSTSRALINGAVDDGVNGLQVNGSAKIGDRVVVPAVQTTASTVVALPVAAVGNKGERRFVTDATQTHTAGIGAIVAGAGANNVPVVSDGAAWRIG